MRWSIIARIIPAASAGSLLLAACGGGEEATVAPTAAPTVVPTAAAQATATLAPTATARPAPTATPVPPPTTTSAPVSTGQMTIALSGFANFEMVTQQGTTKEYLESMYDYVIGAKENGDLDPATGFVSSWTTDAEGKGFAFKTRPNVLFHNGDTATAKDIIAFIDLARAPGSQWSSAPALRTDIVSMDTPDDNTLNVKLSAASIFWHLRNLSLMGSGGSPSHLLSGKYLAAEGYAGYNKKPIGTGPYKFKSAAVNDNLTVEAVEKHWLYGVPRTETMVFRAVPEETTRLALLRAGDADIIPISRAGLKAAQAAGVQIFEKENSGVGAFRFPSTIRSRPRTCSPRRAIPTASSLTSSSTPAATCRKARKSWRLWWWDGRNSGSKSTASHQTS